MDSINRHDTESGPIPLQDLKSGFLVFLVALPLCLGIAIASGFRPVAGLLTAIGGGVMVSFLSGAELAIKGAAAGLIVISLGGAVHELWQGDPVLGYKHPLVVGVVAALVPMGFVLLRAETVGIAMSASGIHGMLAAIGVITIPNQIHTVCGGVPEAGARIVAGKDRAKWPSWTVALVLCNLVSGVAVRAATPDSLGIMSDKDGGKVVLGPTQGLVFQTESSELAFHGYTWLRAKADTIVGDETDLEGSIPIARLFMNGDFLDSKLVLFAQTEFAGSSPELLDLFAEWHFAKAFVLRIGQFRTPYSRAYITPLTNLELPTRGFVIDHFSLGRDTGAMASGSIFSNRFHYDLAVVNGATINDRRGNRDAPSVIGRGEIRFGGGLPYDQAPSLHVSGASGLVIGFGAAYSRRKIDDTSGTTTERRTNASVDLAASRGPASIRAEGFWRATQGSTRAANAFGAFGQLGVFVIPKTLEMGARAGWVSDGPDTQSYEAFLAGYASSGPLVLGHHLKLTLAFRYDTADPGGPSRRDRFSEILQAQLFF